MPTSPNSWRPIPDKFTPANCSVTAGAFLGTYLVRLPTTGLLARNNFRFARHSGPIKADGRESVLPIRIRVPRTCVWHCAADTIVIHRRSGRLGWVVSLEHQLQRHLKLARSRCRAGNDPSRGTNAGACENSNGWLPKVGAIEDIEGLRPELQIPSLVDGDLLEHRHVQLDQVGSQKLVATRIPKRPGSREQEGVGIEPLVGSPQNNRTAEGRVPVGHIRISDIAVSRAIRAHRRREAQTRLGRHYTIPLPAANQLIHRSAGRPAPVFAPSERQLIANVAVELVLDAERCRPFAQSQIIGIQDVGWRAQIEISIELGIDVQNLTEGVIRFKAKTATQALDQCDIQRVVAAGAWEIPCKGTAEKWIGTLSRRHVRSSLGHNLLLTCRQNTTAEASLRVLAHHGPNRIGIQSDLQVIRLRTDIAHLKRKVTGELPLDRQAPFLDGWRV